MSSYGKTLQSENECAPPAHGKRPRVAMVVYSYYPADARIKRAAEALAAGAMDVEVMCLKAEGDVPQHLHLSVGQRGVVVVGVVAFCHGAFDLL